jgi:hypothetical protein
MLTEKNRGMWQELQGDDDDEEFIYPDPPQSDMQATTTNLYKYV